MSSEPNHNRQKNHKALTKKQKEAIKKEKRQRKNHITGSLRY